MNEHIKLRQCILKYLYHYFKEYPYAPVELSQIENECKTTPKDLNWNIVYLEKKGYLELDKLTTCAPYISCLTTITAEGIDLVENENGFNEQLNIKPDEE